MISVTHDTIIVIAHLMSEWLTVDTLAARIGREPRTVYRIIGHIESYGVPLVCRGWPREWRVARGWKIQELATRKDDDH